MEPMKREKISILVHVFMTIASLAACMFLFGILDCREPKDLFKVLSDSFFVTGGAFFGVGLISFAVRKGAFDVSGRSRQDAGEKRRWFKTLTFCGIVCLLAALVFMFLC